jgi:hypothetical protein
MLSVVPRFISPILSRSAGRPFLGAHSHLKALKLFIYGRLGIEGLIKTHFQLVEMLNRQFLVLVCQPESSVVELLLINALLKCYTPIVLLFGRIIIIIITSPFKVRLNFGTLVIWCGSSFVIPLLFLAHVGHLSDGCSRKSVQIEWLPIFQAQTRKGNGTLSFSIFMSTWNNIWTCLFLHKHKHNMQI